MALVVASWKKQYWLSRLLLSELVVLPLFELLALLA